MCSLRYKRYTKVLVLPGNVLLFWRDTHVGYALVIKLTHQVSQDRKYIQLGVFVRHLLVSAVQELAHQNMQRIVHEEFLVSYDWDINGAENSITWSLCRARQDLR